MNTEDKLAQAIIERDAIEQNLKITDWIERLSKITEATIKDIHALRGDLTETRGILLAVFVMMVLGFVCMHYGHQNEIKLLNERIERLEK